jgi:hypothetical protein
MSVYSARSPNSAKALEVKAMKGEVVTPKTAGIESTAKRTSCARADGTAADGKKPEDLLLR